MRRSACCARLPARCRAREEDLQVPVRVQLGLADGVDHPGCPAVHPCGALRCRGGEDQLRTNAGPISAISWATKLPIEKPRRSTRSNSIAIEERDGIARHLLNRAGSRPVRSADTGVVERDDPTVARERINERRIPVVKVAAEVLQQHQRHCADADVTVGVVETVGGTDNLRRCVCVRLFLCRRHWRLRGRYVYGQRERLTSKLASSEMAILHLFR